MNELFTIEDDVLVKYLGKDKIIVIPEGVKAIGFEAFYNNKTAEEIIMPNSLRYIYPKSFSCIGSQLKTIVIPKNVELIDSRAFDCSNIEKIYILSKGICISVDAFDHCYELTDIYFAGNEKDWEDAFMRCDDEQLFGEQNFKIHFNYVNK